MDDHNGYWVTLPPVGDREFHETIAKADELGFEGVFARQFFGAPWVPLAAATQVSDRLRVATGVALSFTRSPFETAMTSLDLDRLSQGRFVLGLGTSVRSWIEDYFDADFDRPLSRLREVITAIRGLTSNNTNRKRFKGEFYDIDASPIELPSPVGQSVPIWVAALRRRLTELAGELADGLIGHPIWSARWIRDEVSKNLVDGAKRAGRDASDVHRCMFARIAANPDVKTALQDAKPTIAFYARLKEYQDYFAYHGYEQEARHLHESWESGSTLGELASDVPDEMAREFMLVGDYETVGERLEELWSVADAICLSAPSYGISSDRAAQYREALWEISQRVPKQDS